MVLLFTLPLLISSITTNPATSNSTYFSIDTARLYLFIIVQFKYIFSLVVVFSITACTSSREAIKVFEYFHFPVWMLAILHYIDQLFRVLSMEFERIRIAYLSRSIKTGLVLKLRTVIGLIYVYTIRIIERSERIFLAMLSKGFNGKFYTDEQLNWRWGDSIIIASCVILTASRLILQDLI
jgi:cobalt/nickel transport system permease protein